MQLTTAIVHLRFQIKTDCIYSKIQMIELLDLFGYKLIIIYLN